MTDKRGVNERVSAAFLCLMIHTCVRKCPLTMQADTLLGLIEAQQGSSEISEEVFVRTCTADAGLQRIFPAIAGLSALISLWSP